MNRVQKAAVIIITLLLVVLGTAYGAGYFYFGSHFLPGTELNEFDVSFKTAAEVQDLLDQKVKSYAIAVEERNGGREKIDARSIGMKYKPGGTVQKLLSGQDRLLWFIPESSFEKTDLGFVLDEKLLEEQISGLDCMQNMSAPTDARILYKEGEAIDISSLTGERKEAAEKYLAEVKEKITNASSAEDIEVLSAEASATLESLLAQETIESQRTAAKEALKEFFDGAKFETDELKAVAQEIYDSAMEAIGQADSIEKINDELDSAKEDIQNVIDQKDGVLDTLKENAKKNIDEARDAIQTESQLPDEVVAMAKEQIDAADSAKTIQSIKTVSKEILANMKSALDEKSKSSVSDTISSLRGISLNKDDPDLLVYMAEKASAAEYADACTLMEAAVEYVSLSDADFKDVLVDDMKDVLADAKEDKAEDAQKIFDEAVSSMKDVSRLNTYKVYENAMTELGKLKATDEVSAAKKEAEASLDKRMILRIQPWNTAKTRPLPQRRHS